MIRPLVPLHTLTTQEPASVSEKVVAAFNSLGPFKYPMIIVFGVAGLLFSEIGAFHWALRRCRINGVSDQATIFVAFSDIHILGSRKSDLDIFWTTFQTRKCLHLIMQWIHPSAIFVLGDHLDQGAYAGENDWKKYVERFRWATQPLRTNEGIIVVDSIVGNHDAQFAHLGNTPGMLDRFVKTFGEVNGVTRIGESIEVVWINSVTIQDDSLSKAHLETMKMLEDLELEASDSKPFRILLSHVPTFRINDMDCGKSRLRESGHVTYVAPDHPLKPGSDVLSPEISRKLLKAVRPDVMLSGHLHSHCYRKNHYEDVFSNQNMTFLDVSVPSLSYRMRPDPGFTLLVIDKNHDKMQAYTKTCRLPNENVIIALDAISLLLIGFTICMWMYECRYLLLGQRSKIE